MRVVGGGAGDIKEPLPLYLKQRALLGRAVQRDGAVAVMTVMVVIVVEEEEEEEEEEERADR